LRDQFKVWRIGWKILPIMTHLFGKMVRWQLSSYLCFSFVTYTSRDKFFLELPGGEVL
jgi:hypothetical protein